MINTYVQLSQPIEPKKIATLVLNLEHDGERYDVNIVSVPALVMLKVVAMNDRPEDRRRKDVTDICFVLRHYLDIGNRDRLLNGADADILDDAEQDLDRATAGLLGRDMGAIMSLPSLSFLSGLLDHETTSQSKCHLAQEVARQYCRGDFARARLLLSEMARGMRDRSE